MLTRLKCWLPVIAVVLGAAWAGPAGGAEVSLKGDFEEPRVIVAAPPEEAHAHLSWPKVVTARDGTIITGYIAGVFHGTHGGGCPAVSISTDGGKSFTRPHVLQEFNKGTHYTCSGNLALGVAEDGSVVLLAMAYTGNERNTVVGWRSEDSGKSWQPVDTRTIGQSRTGSVFGHVFSVPGEGLAVVGHFREGSTTQPRGLWIAYSKDQGRTWGEPRVINSEAHYEPAVVHAAGRFIGLIRHKSNGTPYAQLLSDDGMTWTHTESFGPAKASGVTWPSPCIVVDPAKPGRLYALASLRHSAAAKSGLYGQIDLWTADAKTLEWKRLAVVAKFPRELGDRHDITYAWMTPVGDGEWFVVFYCGKGRGANDIWGLRIRPEAG